MTARHYTSDEIITALQATNGLVSLAARKLACSPNTIYTRARNVKAVQQTIDDCRAELVDYAELALRSAVTDKEGWAVSMVLKTLGKNRGYVERQEVTGADGEPIEIVVVRENKNRVPGQASGLAPDAGTDQDQPGQA